MTDEISRTLILYPVFAMVLLIAGVTVHMARLRVGAIQSGAMSVKFYRTYQEGREPDHMRVVTRHYINLFELPVLFYVVVVLAYVTNQVNAWLVGCAWLYVLSRYVHSWVHLTANNVLLRFRVFIASGIVLLLLWVSLLVQLVRAG